MSACARWLWLWGVWACWVGPVLAQAPRPTIHWVMMDFPPYFLVKEGRAPRTVDELGDGIADRAMADMVRRLPAYRHTYEVLSPGRLWQGFQQGRPQCYAGALKTAARQPHVLFTPGHLLPPVALVLRADRRAQLIGERSAVSLAELLREHADMGLLEDKRSYGAQADAILAAHPVALRREPYVSRANLLRNLSAGHVGFTLEYPMSVEYVRRQGWLDDAPLEIVELQDVGQWMVAHTVCTRNPWGQQVIADIDRVVRDAAQFQPYRELVNDWLPRSMVERHSARLKAYYDERAQSGPKID